MMSWQHAHRGMSEWATELLGRQCYVVPGYDSETREPLLMVVDGKARPVFISDITEMRAAVAELAANVGAPHP